MYKMYAEGRMAERRPDSAFFEAVVANNNDTIRMLLTHEINVNERNWMEQTPLQMAIVNRNYELFITLLYLGADPRAPGELEEPLLEWAFRHFDTDPRFAEELVRRGADVNGRMSYGRPLLSEVITDNNLPAVRFLVTYGADMNAPVILPDRMLANAELMEDFGPENNKTPLYFAVKHGSLEIVKYLVEQGARVTGDLFEALTRYPNEDIRAFLTNYRRRHAMAGFAEAGAGTSTATRRARRSRRVRGTRRH